MGSRLLTFTFTAAGMLVMALFAWQLIVDVVKVASTEADPPLAERIARSDLQRLPENLSDGEAVRLASENGWFPNLRQPIFSWEDGVEGWKIEKGALSVYSANAPTEDDAEEPGNTGPDVSGLQITQTRASDGRSSLQIPVNFPDAVTLHCPAQHLRGVRFIAYDIFLPAEARGYVGCLFFLKDKDGRWYQARSRAPLQAGKWTTVTADIRGGSPDVEPLGHTGQWDENQASQVILVGLTVHGDLPFQGLVLLDRFRGWLRADRFLEQTQPDRMAAMPAEKSKELRPFVEAARNQDAEPVKFLNVSTQPATAWAEAGVLPRVEMYDSFVVRFDLNREIRNPFDPTEADIQAEIVTPSKKTIQTHAFWYQDFERHPRFAAEELVPVGRPEWRVRFTPREAGLYHVRLSASLNKGQVKARGPELRFEAVPGGRRGFVRVAKANPYFLEYDNGEFFYPIGHNVHTPIDTRCWSKVFKTEPPLQRGLTMYEDFFPKMAAHGENVAEVWMAAWWLGIEWTKRWPHFHGPGRYSLERAWLLDRLLELARANGLLIHLVLDNHGKFSSWCDEEWAWNPFNRSSDASGWLTEADDFFTDTRAREWYNRRLRYITARWAGDPAIMGWELVSEYDLTGSRAGSQFHRSEAGRAWARESARALRELDAYEHPIGNHYSTNFTRIDRELMDGAPFNYIATDAYRGGGGANDQSSCVSLLVETDRHFSNYATRKPYWITEYGGHWSGSTPAEGLEADLHSGLWASWLTNAVGTPLLWWYDVIDHRDLYRHFHGFAAFVQGEDRRRLNGTTSPLTMQGAMEGLQGLQYRWSSGAYLWINDLQALNAWPEEGYYPKHQGVQASIPNLAPGNYRIEFWDTLSGQISGSQTRELKAGDTLALDLPPFEIDLAIKVKRYPDDGGTAGYVQPTEPVLPVERGQAPPAPPGTRRR